MNREILFRARRYESNEWVEGFYLQDEAGNSYIRSKSDFKTYVVEPETVGQFTGLTDIHGKQIFEGDIVKFHRMKEKSYGRVATESYEKAIVIFDKGCFSVLVLRKSKRGEYHAKFCLRNCVGPVVTCHIHDQTPQT